MSVPITLEYSTEALASFLDYMADKGLANKNTIASRKAAASKVLEILDAGEAADLRGLDIDEVARRFANLRGTNYSPDSLQVYKSRVAKAVSDFLRYKEDPASFKPAAPQSPKAKRAAAKPASRLPDRKAHEQSHDRPASASSLPSPQAQSVEVVDIPVPLSDGALVVIKGMPVKLKARDAAKISAVVKAMVSDYQDEAPFQKEL